MIIKDFKEKLFNDFSMVKHSNNNNNNKTQYQSFLLLAVFFLLSSFKIVDESK